MQEFVGTAGRLLLGADLGDDRAHLVGVVWCSRRRPGGR
jgi:hypothetical protein